MTVLQDLLQKQMTRKEFLGIGALAVASLFGLGGIIKQIASHAATQNLSSEPETGTLTGPASTVADSTASAGTAVRFGAPVVVTGTYTRPTGSMLVNGTATPIVTYESLLRAGETSTNTDVSVVMARLTTAAIISFPAGRFEVSDFRAGGTANAIVVPKICKGVWGSGPGALGSAAGTVFSMKSMSSTRAAEVPRQDNSTPCPFRLMMHSGALSDVSYGQFHVEGTDQGHIYHGFTSFSPNGALEATDILVTGWKGNNGAPPGETFGFEVHQPKTYTIRRLESDGRRYVGGPDEGAVGLTTANVSSGSTYDSYFHHCAGAQMVLYQCFNTHTYNCRFGSSDDIASSAYGNSINHERTAGNIHHNPVLRLNRSGEGIHITHSNDNVSFNYNGVACSTNNGTLTVINPDYTPLSTHTDGKLWIQSWHPYWTGCSMTGNAVYSGTTITRKIGNIPTILDATGKDVSDTKLHYIHNFQGWNSTTAVAHSTSLPGA